MVPLHVTNQIQLSLLMYKTQHKKSIQNKMTNKILIENRNKLEIAPYW